MKTVDLVFHSDYSPEDCVNKLMEEIDPEQRTVFSLSGYRGKKPVLGSISANEFRLHKRRYWHNDFGPVFYGSITPYGRGSCIEGYWGMPRWTRLFMRVWLMGVAVLGTPILLVTLYELITRRPVPLEELYLGLLVPLGMFLFGLLLPRFGAALGASEKTFLGAFVERTLLATKTNSSPEMRAWDSVLE
jgi:hypothetical protein